MRCALQLNSEMVRVGQIPLAETALETLKSRPYLEASGQCCPVLGRHMNGVESLLEYRLRQSQERLDLQEVQKSW
jgi:hypothetical protein